MDKWVFKRLFVRLVDNGKPFFGDMFYDVKEIFKELLVRFPKSVWYLVRTLIDYTPLLYKSFDWDWHFILRLFKYKITRTRLHIKEHGHLANTDKYCKQMKEVEDLIDLIMEDEFCKKEYAAHDKKWGTSKMVGIEVPGRNVSECRFLRLNVRTKKDEVAERKEWNKISMLEVKRREAAWKELWDKVHQNMRNWWD